MSSLQLYFYQALPASQSLLSRLSTLELMSGFRCLWLASLFSDSSPSNVECLNLKNPQTSSLKKYPGSLVTKELSVDPPQTSQTLLKCRIPGVVSQLLFLQRTPLPTHSGISTPQLPNNSFRSRPSPLAIWNIDMLPEPRPSTLKVLPRQL